jgi:AcrR family transcriptional regulator
MFDILPRMTYPLRILRAIARTHQEPRPLSMRERQSRAFILAAAEDMLAQAGRLEVTFALIAASLRITAATLRRYFACMDEILHTILSDYLDHLFTALEAVPENAPNLLAARRAAYRQASLDDDGRLRPAHHLLLTQAPLLPPDLRADIAEQCAVLGEAMAPGLAKFALMLLDDPGLPLTEAEDYIALKTRRLGAAQAPPPRAAQTPPPRAYRPAEPDPPRHQAPAPRPTPAGARPAVTPARFAEDFSKSDLWASTALQHQDCDPRQARAGP